jgi:hypothetical protein
MREVPRAEEGLADLRDRGSGGVVAPSIVSEPARRLCVEIDRGV